LSIAERPKSDGTVSFDAVVALPPSVFTAVLRNEDVERLKRLLLKRGSTKRELSKDVRAAIRSLRSIAELTIKRTAATPSSTGAQKPSRLRSRKDRITVRGLTAGSYSLTYRVEIVTKFKKAEISLGFTGTSSETSLVVGTNKTQVNMKRPPPEL